MAKTSASNNKVIPELPANKAIFQNEERPYMMYVGDRNATKAGWKKLTEIPPDRTLMQTETGMYVLGKK
ncbi:MAG TPA: hypothetical protein VFH78_00480 [Candidatus Thermoplasmatota archaeon]|nr:hypothetical protein [Candidatus Thermoplasmatota archaeon]